jgi:peptidylprolyl isomerase
VTPTPSPTEKAITEARDGDTVKVHYTGTLDDGTVFDTSIGREPLLFTIGDGQMMPDFEAAVIGMSPGESKTVRIPADQAYGPYDEEMILVIGREDLEEDLEMEPEVGQTLVIRQPDGPAVTVTVIDISESTVTLDFNHPLARQDVTFNIQFVEIV